MRAARVRSRREASDTPGICRALVTRVVAERARRARRRHLLPIDRIAADGQVDPRASLHHAPDQRDILLFDLAIVELPSQLGMRPSFFATTISPDVPRSSRCTMPGLSSPPMPLRSVICMEQRIDERALRVSGGRMHHHSGRLVHDARCPGPDTRCRGRALPAEALGSPAPECRRRSSRPHARRGSVARAGRQS